MRYEKLSSLVNRKIGYGIVQPGLSTGSGVPVIKVNNIISGLKSIEALDTTDPENDEQYARTRLHGGELVVSVVGTIGKTAIVPQSFAGCNLVRAIALIDISDDALCKWVKYYIDSPEGQNYINQHLNTTVQPTLNINSLSEMPIPIYDDNIINSVVKILYLLDQKIEKNQLITDNLTKQVRSVYKSWFIDYEPFGANLPADWELSDLGHIATIKTKSWSPAKNIDEEVEHYSIPAYDEQHYPIFESAAGIKSNKYIITSDSVMISKLNPKVKRIWTPMCLSKKAVCSTEFIVYEANNKRYKDFLYSVLDSMPFYDYLCSHATGSTNSRQRVMPKSTLKYALYLPPDNIISEFCRIVNPMYNKITTNYIENQRLASIRNSLLPRLISGEIDVSNMAI